MQKIDSHALANALNALAETFGKPAVTPKALEVWFDALREFPADQVLTLLQWWPKTQGKFPVPSEVWKTLNDRSINRREQTARAEKAQREQEIHAVTQHGKTRLSAIYDTLLKKPKPEPIEHWRTVLATDGLPRIAYEHARAALARLQRGKAA